MTKKPGSRSLEFPPEYEHVYRGCDQEDEDLSKLQSAACDRRRRIPAAPGRQWFQNEYADVGLLRIIFKGKIFSGTATLIADTMCVLTSAHNVINHDPITNEFQFADTTWFEIRNNKLENGSSLIKRYKVKGIVVHPSYFMHPTTHSGFDLALCWIDVPEDDNTLRNKSYSCLSNPVACNFENGKEIVVVGFPCEREGEKWYMKGNITNYHEEKEIIVYDNIDTTLGQTGGPVMAENSHYIIGVHVGGHPVTGTRWATYITPAKLSWIADQIGNPWHIFEENKTLFLRRL